MTWAVTLDFHNTIARCDDWFNLEVYDLIPAFLAWREERLGHQIEPGQAASGKRYYRELRQQVMDSGIELDAATAVEKVVACLELDVSPDVIQSAMVDIFRPTVAQAEPLAGIVESVRYLRAAGVRLAVISSAAYHPFLEWTLDKFELTGCFCEVLTSASTGHYKSSPRIYETALERLRIEPARCIHVGDSARFDVAPARAVGMHTVLFGDDTEGGVPDLRISTLIDLPRVLKEEFGLPLEI